MASVALVKKLYVVRSTAVHGGALKNAAMVEHVRKARALLSSILVKLVEEGRVPKKDEWDTLLHS